MFCLTGFSPGQKKRISHLAVVPSIGIIHFPIQRVSFILADPRWNYQWQMLHLMEQPPQGSAVSYRFRAGDVLQHTNKSMDD